ncbi:hypothetical protein [Rubritalea marina]|uniref:hypothetical protein n=1 Tax=Rubritalea marina TaxID=361055 RepID=UPI00036581D8|nr:hypothetical protein [Rubritalea marina]
MNRLEISTGIKKDIVVLVQLGAVTGSLAGFMGLLASNGDAEHAGAIAASWTWALAITLPLGQVLICLFKHVRSSKCPNVYGAEGGLAVFRLLCVIGVLGSILGMITAVLAASSIPSLFSFGQLDVVEVRSGLVEHWQWAIGYTTLSSMITVSLILSIAVKRIKRVL